MKAPSKMRVVLGLLVVVLLQSALLVRAIWKHTSELRAGAEVVMETRMRDPRDFFKGHYARFSLMAERLDRADIEVHHGAFQHDEEVYLLLEKPENSFFWQVQALSKEPFEEGVSLKARFESDYDTQLRVSIDLNRYYAPKTRALELESLNRDSQLGIILAVLPDGTPKIKGVSIDGIMHPDPPLFGK